MRSVDPKDPFKMNDQINYDLDSEDELEELMGHDADDDAEDDEEDYDSECPRGALDGKGDDLELVNEGWILPDDYVSDSSDSSF